VLVLVVVLDCFPHQQTEHEHEREHEEEWLERFGREKGLRHRARDAM
jgi:hypothetical protein